MITSRRNFLGITAGLLVAPSIVRASSIMKVRPIALAGGYWANHAPGDHFGHFIERRKREWVRPGVQHFTYEYRVWDGKRWADYFEFTERHTPLVATLTEDDLRRKGVATVKEFWASIVTREAA